MFDWILAFGIYFGALWLFGTIMWKIFGGKPEDYEPFDGGYGSQGPWA